LNRHLIPANEVRHSLSLPIGQTADAPGAGHVLGRVSRASTFANLEKGQCGVEPLPERVLLPEGEVECVRRPRVGGDRHRDGRI